MDVDVSKAVTVPEALKSFLIRSAWSGCGQSDLLAGPLDRCVRAVVAEKDQTVYEVYRDDGTLYTTCTDIGAALYLIDAIDAVDAENLTAGNE